MVGLLTCQLNKNNPTLPFRKRIYGFLFQVLYFTLLLYTSVNSEMYCKSLKLAKKRELFR